MDVWQNHAIFMKKIDFFFKNREKSGCFREIGSPRHFYFGKSSKFVISVLWKRRRSIAYFLHSARTTATCSDFTPVLSELPCDHTHSAHKKKVNPDFFPAGGFFSSYGSEIMVGVLKTFWKRYKSKEHDFLPRIYFWLILRESPYDL